MPWVAAALCRTLAASICTRVTSWLFAGEHHGARIALLLGGAPILVVAGQIQLHLAYLALGFLQGEDLRQDLQDPVLPGDLRVEDLTGGGGVYYGKNIFFIA